MRVVMVNVFNLAHTRVVVLSVQMALVVMLPVTLAVVENAAQWRDVAGTDTAVV